MTSPHGATTYASSARILQGGNRDFSEDKQNVHQRRGYLVFAVASGRANAAGMTPDMARCFQYCQAGSA